VNARIVGYFALVMGIVFLLVGIAGLVPGLTHSPAPEGEATLDGSFGRLFGLFPVNWLHNLVHIVFGIWGIAVFRRFPAARIYARVVAVVYAVLAIMGLIPGLQTTFGLVPLYGHDVWLHAAIAVVAAVFGFASVSPTAATAAGRPHA